MVLICSSLSPHCSLSLHGCCCVSRWCGRRGVEIEGADGEVAGKGIVITESTWFVSVDIRLWAGTGKGGNSVRYIVHPCCMLRCTKHNVNYCQALFCSVG
jgi:hypothetical protein